jgi:hypothetical protein
MFKRIGFSFLLGVIIVIALYLTVVFQWSYSSGERAGWVQKFSRKGWICKTWEGEVAMVSLPGTAPEIFPFTVRDESVATQIAKTVGQRVTLHYEQHRGLPGACFGDTEYWVDAVTIIPWQPLGTPPQQNPAPATVPPSATAPGGAPPAATPPAVPTPIAPAPAPAKP